MSKGRDGTVYQRPDNPIARIRSTLFFSDGEEGLLDPRRSGPRWACLRPRAVRPAWSPPSLLSPHPGRRSRQQRASVATNEQPMRGAAEWARRPGTGWPGRDAVRGRIQTNARKPFENVTFQPRYGELRVSWRSQKRLARSRNIDSRRSIRPSSTHTSSYRLYSTYPVSVIRTG